MIDTGSLAHVDAGAGVGGWDYMDVSHVGLVGFLTYVYSIDVGLAFLIRRYVKDVTRYLPLFKEEGTFIFELDNVLTDSLTGEYASELYSSLPHCTTSLFFRVRISSISSALGWATRHTLSQSRLKFERSLSSLATLSATFYESSTDYPAAAHSDLIIPPLHPIERHRERRLRAPLPSRSVQSFLYKVQ